MADFVPPFATLNILYNDVFLLFSTISCGFIKNFVLILHNTFTFIVKLPVTIYFFLISLLFKPYLC